MNEKACTRVLIAFDCAHPNREILLHLPQLIGSESLELTGLYVEDEDLMRAACLPGLREISLSGQELELTLERLQEEMATDLSRIREAFESIARTMRLRHRFEVARGRITEALCAAAQQSDFVLVTRTLRHSGLRPRMGTQFGPLLTQSKRILFVNEPWASGTSIVVVGDDSAAIDAGARLATAEALKLVIALPAGAEPSPGASAASTIVRLTHWTEDSIADLCLVRDARLLILPGDESLDAGALLARLMDRLPCSLLKLG